MMRDSKSSGKKPIQEVQAPRAHKPKLERLSRDITQRKRAEEELKRSKEWLAGIINALDDPVFVKDEEHRWAVLNDAACEVMGRPREELIGKTDYDLFSKEQADVFWKRDKLVLKNGQTDINEEEITWHGKLHTISTKKSVFTDFLTGKKFIAGTIRDITERKKAEQEIHKLAQFQQSIIDNADVWLNVIDGKGNIQIWNKAAEKISGYSKKEVIGNSKIWQWSYPEEKYRKEIFRKYMEILCENEVLEDFETQIRCKNGKNKTISWNSRNLLDAEGNPVGSIALGRDITERKQAEETLSKVNKCFLTFGPNPDENVNKIVETAGLILEGTCTLYNKEEGALLCTRGGWNIPDDLKREDTKVGHICYDVITKHKDEPFIVNNLDKTHYAKSDPNVVKYGLKTYIGCAVKVDTKAIGSLCVVYQEDKIFSLNELKILSILAKALGVEEERKRAEERLRESEFKYRSLFENMLNGFAYCKIIVDEKNKPTDFIYLDVNDAFEKLTGLKRKDVIRKKVTEAIPGIKEAHPELFDIYGKVALTGKEDKFDIHFKPLDIWLSISVYSPQKGYFVAVFDNITERKKAEEVLRESEEKYRAIFEQAADSIVLVDGETGALLEFNDRAHETLGYTRDEFRKLKIPDFEVIESSEEVDKHIKKIVKEGADTFETKHRRKDGKIRDALVSSRAISIDGRDFCMSIWRDITKRKRAEEALRLERDNFVNILDSMEDGVYIVDQNHDIQYVNPTLKKEFGPFEDRKCYECFHDRKEVCPWCKNKEVFAGKTVRWEWYSSKNQRTYDLIDTPLRNPDGSISKLEIFRDITERKKAEETLQKKTEELRVILDSVPAGIWYKDTENRVIRVNKAGAESIGMKVEDIEERAACEIFPDDAEHYYEDDLEVIKSGKPKLGITERMQVPGGEKKWVHTDKVPYWDEQGNVAGLIAFVMDITERKKAEEKLLEYQAQLRSLASELSLAEEHERRRIATELHDQISQSLVISKMKVDRLRESASGKELNKALDEIANSLGQTIADTRSLTSEVHSPLLALLGFEEAVAEWLSEQIQKKHGIAAEFEDDGLPKPLDDDIRILLFRDVRELLTNVVRHAHAHKVKVSIRKVGSQIGVSVEDDGVGFDPAEIASMATETNAFGLFSIQERLEELRGHFEIESEPGQGVKVTITAPLQGEKNIEGRKI